MLLIRIGCMVLYTGQGKLHKSTTDTMDYIINRANCTINNLKDVSQHLGAAENVGADEFSLPFGVRNNIDKMLGKIDVFASVLEYHTRINSRSVQNALDSV